MKKRPAASSPGYHRIRAGRPSAGLLRTAASVLRRGGILIFPTDTFYGLGADPENSEAVEKLYRIKGRGADQAVPLVVAGRASVDRWVREVPESAGRLMDAFWPGPLTLLFFVHPARSALPSGGTGKIALRVPGHPAARALLSAWDGALTATSANPTGDPPPASIEELDPKVYESAELILDAGPTPGGAPSTIVDATLDPPRLIRKGAIPFCVIMERLGYGLTEPHDR